MGQRPARKQHRPRSVETSFGIEELNLAEFPLGVLADRVPQGIKTLEFEDEIQDREASQRVTRRVTISGSDKWGLPTWQDTDVLLGLMKLTNDKNGFQDRTVPFSLYELRELLQWPNDGRYKARLRQSLKTLLGVTIAYENAFRRGERWVSLEGFHLIDNVRLTNTVDEYDSETEQLFKWNDVIVESIQSNHTKGLDWEFYIGLEGAITKRLYRFLDKRWKLGRRWSYELEPFCRNKLGMCGESYRPSDFKKKLWPSLKELMDRGVLAERTREECIQRVRKGLYRVDFEKAAARGKAAKKEIERAAPTGLVEQLLARDVRNAAKLAASYPESRIREQLENFDHRRTSGEKLGGGWLRKAIEEPNGYAFRTDYQSKEELQAAAERERLRIARRKKAVQKRIEKDQEEKGEIEAFLSSLSVEERVQIEREAVASNPALRRWAGDAAEGCSEAIKQAATHAYVERLFVKRDTASERAGATKSSISWCAQAGQLRRTQKSTSVGGEGD